MYLCTDTEINSSQIGLISIRLRNNQGVVWIFVIEHKSEGN